MKPLAAALAVLIVTVSSVAPCRAEDTRQLVDMPPPVREVMRQEMLDFLTTLNQIIGLVADNKLKEIAPLAEENLGSRAMGRHGGGMGGMAPGRYMPEGMRSIAMGLHASGSELGRVAAAEDRVGTLDALQTVTKACVACHAAYRTR